MKRSLPDIAAVILAAVLWAAPSSAAEDAGIPMAVAAFDNYDTAGEAAEPSAAHAVRVKSFAGLVQEQLAAEGRYRIVPLDCAESPCSAGEMPPDELVRAARDAGARVLVYGGIHKMSTLVQMGKIQAIDLEREMLLVDRSFSFRGDTDEAFRRAAEFVVRYVDEAAPAP